MKQNAELHKFKVVKVSQLMDFQQLKMHFQFKGTYLNKITEIFKSNLSMLNGIYGVKTSSGLSFVGNKWPLSN